MTSPTKTVSFSNFTNPADQAAAAIEQEQIALRQRLAETMRARALQDDQVAPGSRVSWTQGLARLAEIMSARGLTRENQAAQWNMNARQVNALAARHDPTNTDVQQVDLTQNPYRAARSAPNAPGAPAPSPQDAPPPAQVSSPAPFSPTAQAPAAVDPTVPADLDISTPQGRQQALALMNGQPATTPQPNAPAVPAPADPAVSASSPDAQQLGPSTDRLLAALRARRQSNGKVPNASPSDQIGETSPQALAETLKRQRLAGQAAAGQPTAQPSAEPFRQLTHDQQHQNVTALLTGVRAPHSAPAPQQASAGQGAPGDAAFQPQSGSAPGQQGYPAQPADPATLAAVVAGAANPTDAAKRLLARGVQVGSPEFQAGMAAFSNRGAPAPVSALQPDQQRPPSGPVMDAQVPTMTARQAYMMEANDPQGWSDLVKATYSPNEITKSLMQAGIDPHSSRGQQIAADALKKQALTPLNDDKRGYLTDPYTGQVVSYHPQISEGATPVFDAQGNVAGERPIANAVETAEAMAGAHARGQAQGETVAGWDPVTQQPTLVPKPAVLAGNGGQPFHTGPAMGTDQGAKRGSDISAQAFHDDAQAAAGAPQRRFLLNQIKALGQVTVTGEGAPAMAAMKSRMNTALAQAGMKPWFDNNGIANVQEIQKNAANLAQQQAAAYGGQNGSTDAKLSAAFASLPDANKAPQAIQTIVGILSAREDEGQAKGQASAAYFRTHGATPTSHADFSSAWTRNADPELFQRIAKVRAGAGSAALTAGLNKAQAAEMLGRYRQLKAMGAF